jgi:hypothetical protein
VHGVWQATSQRRKTGPYSRGARHISIASGRLFSKPRRTGAFFWPLASGRQLSKLLQGFGAAGNRMEVILLDRRGSRTAFLYGWSWVKALLPGRLHSAYAGADRHDNDEVAGVRTAVSAGHVSSCRWLGRPHLGDSTTSHAEQPFHRRADPVAVPEGRTGCVRL